MHNERCTSGSEGGPKKPGGRKADRALRSAPTVNPMKRNPRQDAELAMTTRPSPLWTALLLTATRRPDPGPPLAHDGAQAAVGERRTGSAAAEA